VEKHADFRRPEFQAAEVTFSESSDHENLYELEVSSEVSERAAELFDEIFPSIDRRDLADAITSGGAGQFFEVRIRLASFREDFVEAARKHFAQLAAKKCGDSTP